MTVEAVPSRDAAELSAAPLSVCLSGPLGCEFEGRALQDVNSKVAGGRRRRRRRRRDLGKGGQLDKAERGEGEGTKKEND